MLLQVLSPVSMSAHFKDLLLPPRLLLLSFPPSPPHSFFSGSWPSWIGPPQPPNHSPPETATLEKTLSFPAAAICLLNFNPPMSEMSKACSPRTLLKIKPILNNFLGPILIVLLNQGLETENLTSHILLLAFSFAPNFFALFLRSSPDCFNAGCKTHSFSPAAFLKLLIQRAG